MKENQRLLFITGLLILNLKFIICGDPVKFDKPYFLILGRTADAKRDLLISTDSCLAGAFTNMEVTLKEFCVKGIWLLTDSSCASEESTKYIVTGRDSCFKLDDFAGVQVKKFMPLTQDTSDLAGKAFAIPNNFGYFVALNPNNITDMRPLSQPRNEWNILTVNYGVYGRRLNEMARLDDNTLGNRTCYNMTPHYITQVYDMADGAGTATFLAYKSTLECRPGYAPQDQMYHMPTGTFRNLRDDTVYNSTFTYKDLDLEAEDVAVPYPGIPPDGVCPVGDNFSHPALNRTINPGKYPDFPHTFDPIWMEHLIVDEIKETSKKFMEYKLFNEPLPTTNRTEYKYVVASTIALAKYCCHDAMDYDTILDVRRLFRLSMAYYMNYFAYDELGDPKQEERILDALGQCVNQTVGEGTCIYVNYTEECPKQPNSTSMNHTIFNDTEIDPSIEWELGNLDYVSELIWKSSLFAHYYCAPFFKIPTDHSAFYTKLEDFFNPLFKQKWSQPMGVQKIYEMLLTRSYLPDLSKVIDLCVATAKAWSEYEWWLARPGTFTYQPNPNRTKRESDPDLPRDCVPQDKPKLFCMEKQFDIIEKKLEYPKPSPGVCGDIYKKRQSYPYIHAKKFGTNYQNDKAT